MKRLLVVGSSRPNRIEAFYRRSLEIAGVDVQLLDPERVLARLIESRIVARLTAPLHGPLVQRALIDAVRRERPDAVLVFKGFALAPAAIRRARSLAAVPWLNYNPDSPLPEAGSVSANDNIRRSIALYDAYGSWSETLLPGIREAGAKRVFHLPFAHDELAHKPPATRDPALARTVTFVGSFDDERARLLGSLSEFSVRVYGGGWTRARFGARVREIAEEREVMGVELNRVVASSMAHINLLRAQNRDSHNMRTFEVPATGGLMLTWRNAEQQRYFPEGEACLMYGSDLELRAQIRALVHNEIDAELIRTRAREAARAHTYGARARSLLEVYSDLGVRLASRP